MDIKKTVDEILKNYEGFYRADRQELASEAIYSLGLTYDEWKEAERYLKERVAG